MAGGAAPIGGRRLWVMLHRWAGLTISLFLCVAGTTGALLAFYDELHLATAPALLRAQPPAPGAAMLDPLELRDRAERASGGRIDYTRLDQYPGRTMFFYPKPLPGAAPLAYEEIRLNPYTGVEQSRRTPGDLSEGVHNLMPFVYDLHHELALGEIGRWAFGIAALIWALDCFVGVYLTLPTGRARRLGRWRKAWTIKRPVQSSHRLKLDFHTAGGLWLWPMLFVFAWSAVSFNLRPVYDPVMTAVLGPAGDTLDAPALDAPLDVPAFDWRTARAHGRALAAKLADQHGFTVQGEMNLGIDRSTGIWRYGFSSDREVFDKYGQSRIYFRDSTGELVRLSLPSGQTARQTADSWLVALHLGFVFGLPYRLFVMCVGLAVTGLSVTGVLIWMRKRSARLLRSRRGTPGLALQPAE